MPGSPASRSQWGNNSLDRFQVLSRKCSPLHRLVLSPSLARFTGGRTWFLLKATSTGRPASRSFFVKGERPDRTAEHKKKTMKTNTNKNQKSEAQSRPEQLSTSTGDRPKINMELRRANRQME